MTGREWKPGEVAATEYRGVTSQAMVVEGKSCPTMHPTTAHWHSVSGGWNPLTETEVKYRPLVVIDPEDRDQVEDICRRYVEAYGGRWDGREKPVSDMQAALRSLVEPPKPEEPTGLGAVVEDADGIRYVLHGVPDGEGWCDPDGIGRRWGSISAVRVLSEGVTS